MTTTLGPPPPGLEVIARLSLPQLCGQLLVVGLPDTRLPSALAESLGAALRGGVILFRRNLPEVAAGWQLIQEILRAAPPELAPLIAVDEEGGPVRRLPLPFVGLPPMRLLGRTEDPHLCYRAGSVVARQLAAIGFTCNFAPVLDVDSNPNNPVIGERSFGSDPRKVAHLAQSFALGMQDQGVMACGKHFPGHGDTHADSHRDLPVVSHARERLERVELLPFREAATTALAAVMTAHVRYPALDPEHCATLSPTIINGLLRHQYGFEGVVFSDDLEMRGVLIESGLEEAAVGAIRAGCDALLVCHDPLAAERVLDALVTTAEEEPEFSARIVESAVRFLTARRNFPPRPALTLSGLLQMLAQQPEARAVVEEITTHPES